MIAGTVNIKGESYVIVPEREYRELAGMPKLRHHSRPGAA